MGQVGWFLSQHSHSQFLPNVLHRKHVKTLARPFKDFDMMILEPFLHDTSSIFGIIVLLILPADVLFQFLLRIVFLSSKNWKTCSIFNDTVNLDKVSTSIEREASSLYYIFAITLYAGHGVLCLVCFTLFLQTYYICPYGQITPTLPHHTIVLLIKHWNYYQFDLLQRSYMLLLEQLSLPTMTSIDTLSMQDSLTVGRVTFVPTWSCISIRDFVVVQFLLWTTG